MGRGESEHHVSVSLGQSEQEARQIGRHRLAEGSEEGNEQHHPEHVGALCQCAYIDEHADTDEEIGNEEGVASELDAVHERRDMRYIPI